MKLTLDYEPDILTNEDRYILRKDGICVTIRYTEEEANEAFEKFVESQREAKSAKESKTLKTVEI